MTTTFSPANAHIDAAVDADHTRAEYRGAHRSPAAATTSAHLSEHLEVLEGTAEAAPRRRRLFGFKRGTVPTP